MLIILLTTCCVVGHGRRRLCLRVVIYQLGLLSCEHPDKLKLRLTADGVVTSNSGSRVRQWSDLLPLLCLFSVLPALYCYYRKGFIPETSVLTGDCQ